jgi:hypothetical protein
VLLAFSLVLLVWYLVDTFYLYAFNTFIVRSAEVSTSTGNTLTNGISAVRVRRVTSNAFCPYACDTFSVRSVDVGMYIRSSSIEMPSTPPSYAALRWATVFAL